MCLFSSKASYQKPVIKSQLPNASYQKPVIKSQFLLSVHAQNPALLPDPPSNLCVPVESQTCLCTACMWLQVQDMVGTTVTLCRLRVRAGYLEPLSICIVT